MPKVKIGNEIKQIPFDADAIAELVHLGHSVYPDDGISEELWREQGSLVLNSLKHRTTALGQGGNKDINTGISQSTPNLNEADSYLSLLQRGMTGTGSLLDIRHYLDPSIRMGNAWK